MLFEHTRSAILATSIIELISLLHSSKVRRLFFPNNKERKVNYWHLYKLCVLKTSKPCVLNVVAIERFDCITTCSSLWQNFRKFQLRKKWNASVCMVLLRAITEHLQAEVSVGEVMSCPNRLGTSNADDPDGIPPELIKECSTKSPQVCAWSSTTHSAQVKFLRNWNLQIDVQCNIHPLKKCKGNFQSILLPPIVRKVLERLVFDHLLIIQRK